MVSISSDSEVWKAPIIQRAALYCIFFNLVMFLMVGTPLKNHDWNLYKVMGRIQVLYRSHFYIERRSHKEFLSIFMALRVERHFVA